MDNATITTKKDDVQRSDVGLNLVGPTITPLDADFLRDNAKFAKAFERLNGVVL